jgi:lactate dehydrogenase-like 2-hydroxyacid dehydrogenase
MDPRNLKPIEICALDVGRLPPSLLERLARRFELLTLPEAPQRADFFADHGGRIRGLVTSAAVGVDAGTLGVCPQLEVVSSFGVGLDRLPLEEASRRGVAVGYTPDVLNDCVADLAFALLLDSARRVGEADRFVRRRAWPQGAFGLARKVSGARLGLVGLGRIGRAIAERSTGFRMDVRYHSRRPVVDALWAHEPDLLALASWADFLVIITSGGPQTKHLIDARVIDALGPEGVLVNVARGSVVDEQALVQALHEGRLGGAGLDVFADEPHVPAALLDCERVVLTPHIASATQQTRQAMADRVYDNLAAWFDTGRLVSAAPAV